MSWSHLSQGQVTGIACGAFIFFVVVAFAAILAKTKWSPSTKARYSCCIAAVVLSIGLSVGLTRSTWAPNPKILCGTKSSDRQLCDSNATCIDGKCECNDYYLISAAWTTAILSQARSGLAATSVGSLALFAGGSFTGMCCVNRADVTPTAVSCMHVVRTLTFDVKG